MRMNRWILVPTAFLLVAGASADTLELKGGTTFRGTYQGGTPTTVQFATEQGLKVVPTAEIVALRFDGPVAVQLPAAAPANAGPALPVGTVLMVRNVDGLTSHDKKGKKFAVTLDAALSLGNQIVVPAGAKGYGTVVSAHQAGRVSGKSSLVVTLSELVVNGQTLEVKANELGGSGKGSGGKVVGGAAFGAAIGAFSGNAGRGAAIGATVGAAKKGQTIGVPPGTLIEFTLVAPLVLP